MTKTYSILSLALFLFSFSNTALARYIVPDVNFAVGKTWDRVPVENVKINHNDDGSKIIESLILHTAKITPRFNAPIPQMGAVSSELIGYGTGVYLGVYNNQHVVMTNYHVVPTTRVCAKINVQFPSGKAFCSDLIYSNEKFDVSLIAVRLPENENDFLSDLGNLRFENQISLAGTRLITAGIGAFENKTESITIDNSPLCVLMLDTDQKINIIPSDGIKTESIVHSCEFSAGDSGSVIINKQSGKIVGLNFFVATERSELTHDDAIMQKNIGEMSKDIAKEILASLTYAISAEDLNRAFQSGLNDKKFINSRATLESILQQF